MYVSADGHAVVAPIIPGRLLLSCLRFSQNFIEPFKSKTLRTNADRDMW